ncbi:MAG TPA: hypothetical protein DEQ38_01140 [Elusimicrobia bacterium]|nr:MAG: hypothetical protein A2089_06325 [Elusimicrobia bacterium GWD2_63_28]HCC46715.1 hypothetical protein [Elusimicrobiota bacterium]
MTNKNRRSLLSAQAGAFGGRLRGSLRVYALGGGADTDIYFSFRLWLAAAQRQQRLSGQAAYAVR